MKKNLSIRQINQQTHLIVHSDSLFVYRASSQALLNLKEIKKKIRKLQDLTEVEYIEDNLWIDLAGYQKVKRTLYPTENSEALLKRVIMVSTSHDDLVADFFAGSGTTLAIAEKLKRQWIGADIGLHSINEIRKRILKQDNITGFSMLTVVPIETTLESEKEQQERIEIEININNNEVVIIISNYKPSEGENEGMNIPFIDLIDYWEVDWNYINSLAKIDWNSFREIKRKNIVKRVEKVARNEYSTTGEKKIFVNIIDIFGNTCEKILRIRI
jgi:hypothetical protein